MNTPEETVVWRGCPSQWTNVGIYLLCVVLAAGDVVAYRMLERNPLILTGLIVPVLWMLIQWLRTRSHVYELTTERLRESRGMLSRRSTELELYRVRDYTLVEPLLLRLVGCGNLVLATADRSSPEILIRAVHDVKGLKEQIRTHTERMRQSRGVRDFEINPQ